MDAEKIFKKHLKGKLEIKSKIELKGKEDLSIAYTPGVAEICKAIAANPDKSFDYTIRSNTIGIISDGSAVLGLGNIGPEAAMPVMEGKAILFKEFGGVDAIPIVLRTQDAQEIIKIIKALAPSFGGINLEDISAPRCFEINDALQNLGIPVFHDDQFGTAIVVYAGLINALKLANKSFKDTKVVINGAGAAGISIAKFLGCRGISNCDPVKDIIVLDSKGIVSKNRTNLNKYKEELLEYTNKESIDGDLAKALKEADVFIGVSKANLVSKAMVQSMAEKPIIFALANPIPEIMPGIAKEAGAFIVATGRSDFPNQVNNVLAFPGIFKGALESRAKTITMEMMVASAKAIASLVNPSPERILPEVFMEGLAEAVASEVKRYV